MKINTAITSLLVKTYLGAALISSGAMAATIAVEPGVDTLRSAVTHAAAGDVLELSSGVYLLSYDKHLIIDKDLTLRSINSAVTPTIKFEYMYGDLYNNIEISGSDTDFILQGIQFTANNTGAAFLIQGEVSSVALLENKFYGIYTDVKQTTSPDGDPEIVNDLIIVGNTMSRIKNGPSRSMLGADKNFLFAGNTLSYSDLIISNMATEAHIIGNHINTDSSTPLQLTGNSQFTHIIGNLFEQHLGWEAGESASERQYKVATLWAGDGEFRNNIVKQGINIPAIVGTPGSFQVLDISHSAHWDVSNNVFELASPAIGEHYTAKAVFTTAFGLDFTNNIIIGYTQDNMFEFSTPEAKANFTFSNNLCFNNTADCPASAGLLTLDPKFVDSNTYLLAADSPAIDAGVDTNVNRDLDGSVADLGVHAGSFPYLQFAAQRDSGTAAQPNVKPWLYPLFEANMNLSNTGKVKVKAAAIARLR